VNASLASACLLPALVDSCRPNLKFPTAPSASASMLTSCANTRTDMCKHSYIALGSRAVQRSRCRQRGPGVWPQCVCVNCTSGETASGQHARPGIQDSKCRHSIHSHRHTASAARQQHVAQLAAPHTRRPSSRAAHAAHTLMRVRAGFIGSYSRGCGCTNARGRPQVGCKRCYWAACRQPLRGRATAGSVRWAAAGVRPRSAWPPGPPAACTPPSWRRSPSSWWTARCRWTPAAARRRGRARGGAPGLRAGRRAGAGRACSARSSSDGSTRIPGGEG
jgi:hypothetical protein